MPKSRYAVEVLHNSGTEAAASWTVSSGYCVGGDLVLTAKHGVGRGTVLVRFWGDSRLYDAEWVGDGTGDVDLALVRMTAPDAPEAPAVRAGFVDSELTSDLPCKALGYPWWREGDKPEDGPKPRGRAQLNGYVPTAEGPVGGRLALRVDVTPQDQPAGVVRSVWKGISGTVVFTPHRRSEIAIGVVVEHRGHDGLSVLTLEPFTAVDRMEAGDRELFRSLLRLSDAPTLPRPRRGRAVAAAAVTVAAISALFVAWSPGHHPPAPKPTGLNITDNKAMRPSGPPAKVTFTTPADDKAVTVSLEASDSNSATTNCVPATRLHVSDQAGHALDAQRLASGRFEVVVPPTGSAAVQLDVVVENPDDRCLLDLAASLR